MRNLEPEKEWVSGLRNMQILKGVGGCETPDRERSGWLRNPHTLKSSGRVRNPKP